MDTDDGAPRFIAASFVSGDSFEVLGMNAYLGRLLTPADDVRGGPAEGWPVVLDYGFWKDNFGGDPSVIGKQIRLSNTVVTVLFCPRSGSVLDGSCRGSRPRAGLPAEAVAAENLSRPRMDQPRSPRVRLASAFLHSDRRSDLCE